MTIPSLATVALTVSLAALTTTQSIAFAQSSSAAVIARCQGTEPWNGNFLIEELRTSSGARVHRLRGTQAALDKLSVDSQTQVIHAKEDERFAIFVFGDTDKSFRIEKKSSSPVTWQRNYFDEVRTESSLFGKHLGYLFYKHYGDQPQSQPYVCQLGESDAIPFVADHFIVDASYSSPDLGMEMKKVSIASCSGRVMYSERKFGTGIYSETKIFVGSREWVIGSKLFVDGLESGGEWSAGMLDNSYLESPAGTGVIYNGGGWPRWPKDQHFEKFANVSDPLERLLVGARYSVNYKSLTVGFEVRSIHTVVDEFCE